MNPPFYFYSQADMVFLLGIKAKDPAELLDGISKVPVYSIYHHTHRFLQQHHYLSPEPPNDFAYWLTSILNLRELGEAMASIDIVRWKSMKISALNSSVFLTITSPRGSTRSAHPRGANSIS